jgi:glycosyltransferase involved in cell wall biosynthesis
VQRILIDITRLFYRRSKGRLPTGIDRVSLEYIRHYRSHARAVLSLGPLSAVLSPKDSSIAFSALLASGDTFDFPTIRIISKAIFTWPWSSLDVRGCIFFNTGHMGLEGIKYAWFMRACGARPVVVISDLLPISYPHYFRRGEDVRHAKRIRRALEISDAIVTISQHTQDVLQTYIQQMKLTAPPMIVAPLATSLPNLPVGVRPISTPYFVMLGTIEPRKNHTMILQIWRRSVQSMGASVPKLIIIGQRGWDYGEVIALIEQSKELEGIVFEKSSCTDGEVITYLHHAQALLFPTFAEGYGLPLMEALALGVPVIASDLPVFQEIAGDVPDFASPHDSERWMSLINDYATIDSARAKAQRERIAKMSHPNWSQHFQLVDTFLDELNAPRQR